MTAKQLIYPLIALAIPCIANAITLSTTDWNYPSHAFNSVSQAGTYFPSSLESDTHAANITISSAPTSATTSNSECGASDPAWKLRAKLISAPSGLTIKVKRTDSGIGGALHSGISYSTLSALPTTLFCGWGNVSDISLQYQVISLGVEDGYGLKTWNVSFTVETL